MEFTIIPFKSVGNFIFLQKIDYITKNIFLEKISEFEEIADGKRFLIQNFNGALAYYFHDSKKLFYVYFTKEVDLKYKNKSLFKLTAQEILDFLLMEDEDIHIEDYVGFTSFKLGIDIYCPNFTEDKMSEPEGISVAIDGYFEGQILDN